MPRLTTIKDAADKAKGFLRSSLGPIGKKTILRR